ncbi:hypothetical protein BJG92_03058 [Arthrobacter sp. SO5]|uniref:hypothetical protein n=1 Tax=Arthrobacter sp. SO5 TaxID=1897055 RepID=UPI001E400D04|nr:hypothetical protein [Arthrobacter sp. SO5]MCB5275507.1 hypothetical protein [Arthrobacter sp. SO5]
MSAEAAAVEEFRQVVDALAKVDGWNGPDHGIKPSFGSLKKSFQRGDKREAKAPGYNPRCAYIGCNVQGKKLVSSNSHVIAKSASIMPLADPRTAPHLKVLQPDYRDLTNPALRPVDVGQASTFIGYCRPHEDSFQTFEREKELKTTEHYMLQLMRSAAREVWKKEVYINSLEEIGQTYKGAVDGLRISSEEKDHWRKRIQSPVDDLQTEAAIQWGRLHSIHTDLYAALHSNTLPRWVIKTEYESNLKVALSGSTFLDELPAVEGAPAAPMFVMAVIPNGNKTLMLLASSSDDSLWVQSYGMAHLANPDALTQAWMGATDHWFTSPEWWNDHAPEALRRDVLDRLARP